MIESFKCKVDSFIRFHRTRAVAYICRFTFWEHEVSCRLRPRRRRFYRSRIGCKDTTIDDSTDMSWVVWAYRSIGRETRKRVPRTQRQRQEWLRHQLAWWTIFLGCSLERPIAFLWLRPEKRKRNKKEWTNGRHNMPRCSYRCYLLSELDQIDIFSFGVLWFDCSRVCQNEETAFGHHRIESSINQSRNKLFDQS